MLDLLTWAWQGAENPLFEARARETARWVLHEMIADGDGSGAQPTGAFASSLDADSEGEEGKFYVWGTAEIDAVLGDDAAFFKDAYDVTPGGNWEGKTILNRSRKPELGDDTHEAKLAGMRAKLFEARAVRIRPTWDDKVLADWNGLIIASFARAAPVFGEPAWLAAAARAFAFIVERMTEDGRLKHAWRHGQLKHPATLDDYANMADAALALNEATGDGTYIARAEAWTEVLERHYWDGDAGGYFLTADDTEQLIVRAKSAHDHALPAGNGTMVGVLARLFYLTGKSTYRDKAESLIAAFSGELSRNAFALASFLNNADFLEHAVQIVIVGARDAPDTQALLSAVNGACLPNRVLQAIEPGAALPEAHPAHGKGQAGGKATAYVCHGQACSLPLTDPTELTAALAG